MWGIAALISPEVHYRPLLFLLTGEVLRTGTHMVGGSLDQSNLTSGLFRFSILFGAMLCLAGLARFLADWQQRAARSAYRALSVVLFANPVALLLIFAIHLLRYVAAMGWTPKRAAGFLFIAVSGGLLVVFIRFTWRSPGPPKSRRQECADSSLDSV